MCGKLVWSIHSARSKIRHMQKSLKKSRGLILLSLLVSVLALPVSAKDVRGTTPAKKLKMRKPGSAAKARFVLSGFVEMSKDKKYYFLDTGNRRYVLKRKPVFIENQHRLLNPSPKKWSKLTVKHSDIVKVIASKKKAQAKDVL